MSTYVRDASPTKDVPVWGRGLAIAAGAIMLEGTAGDGHRV
jgi:hypothetical protein